jgi:hypothetical protein
MNEDVMGPDSFRSKAQEAKDLFSEWFTVAGITNPTTSPNGRERWVGYYQTETAEQAEQAARAEIRTAYNAVLWVAAVFPGQLRNADTYATFADNPERTTLAT